MTKMTKNLRKAAEEVLVGRWSEEMRRLGVSPRAAGRQIARIAKMTDREIWWALKNGA